jgi:hypothetical protein
MALLELVKERPNWAGALEVALTRPAGVPERRKGDDPWRPEDAAERPRRISDDLAWFRDALEEPDGHGLIPLSGTATAGAWEPEEDDEILARIKRLQDRGVLDAAGFLLHDDELPLD